MRFKINRSSILIDVHNQSTHHEVINMRLLRKYTVALSTLLILTLTYTTIAEAHCDSMDGPVVQDAIKALESGNLDPVLIWITEDQEDEVSRVFQEALKIRDTSEEVRSVADRYFFETVVRLHREAEGATYTGLKPAGTDFGPAVPAADLALESGSLKEVRDILFDEIEEGLHHYYHNVVELQNYDPKDIEAGRAYVNAYVKFMHYIEPLYEIATSEVTHGVGGHHAH